MENLIIRMALLSVSSLCVSMFISSLLTDQFDAVIVAFNIGLDLCAAVGIGACLTPYHSDFK